MLKRNAKTSHDDAITYLQIMNVWASYALDHNLLGPIFDKHACERVEQWTREILDMLKGEDENDERNQ